MGWVLLERVGKVRRGHRHGGHVAGRSLVGPGSGDSRRHCPGCRGQREVLCGRGGAAQDPARLSPPTLLLASPSCSWQNRLTPEVLDNVSNAEICEQGDDGQ